MFDHFRAGMAIRRFRMEHARMNTLIEQMAGIVTRDDALGYGGLSVTLLIVMQHNLKEEQMRYPMADRFLAARREGLPGRMQAD